MTGLGCTISNCPPYVEPELIKLYTALFAVAGYAIEGSGTKPGLCSLVGVLQWFAQIPRWHYSVFDCVYDFVKDTHDKTRHSLSSALQSELVMFMWLAPLLSADLERGFLDLLVASDASTSFGYGVSYTKIGSAAVH